MVTVPHKDVTVPWGRPSKMWERLQQCNTSAECISGFAESRVRQCALSRCRVLVVYILSGSMQQPPPQQLQEGWVFSMSVEVEPYGGKALKRQGHRSGQKNRTPFSLKLLGSKALVEGVKPSLHFVTAY
eukprot:2075221-Rhodomonas_salina.1